MRKFEFKPWVWYLTLEENVDHKIKKIYVKPNHRFSLQYHNDREEHWTVIDGIGQITQGDKETTIRSGESAFIPKKGIHRLTGGEDGITFIEVQRGICKENDIVRLEDDYGRIDKKPSSYYNTYIGNSIKINERVQKNSIGFRCWRFHWKSYGEETSL